MTLFLQAFFKALFQTTLPLWCFVFVTLFNLQGTHRVPRRNLMISHRFRFVKNFFRAFRALSFAAFLCDFAPLSQATRLGYHSALALSRTFFGFFSPPNRSLIRRKPLAFPAPRPLFPSVERRLLILANHPSLVNSFFPFFVSFLNLFQDNNICRSRRDFHHKMCPPFALFYKRGRVPPASRARPAPE